MKFAGHEDSPDKIQKYVNFPALPRNFGLLKDWADVKHFRPELKALADQIFSVQATSSLLEHLFSNAGFIVNDRECCLAVNKIDDLLRLKPKSC